MRNITQLVPTAPVKRCPQLEPKLAKDGRDLTQSSKKWDDRNQDLVYKCPKGIGKELNTYDTRLGGTRPGRLTEMALAILLLRPAFASQGPVRYHDKCQREDQKDEAEKKPKEEALDMK